jgi:hypothetical protein
LIEFFQVDISHEIRAISQVDVSDGTFCTFSNLETSWLDEQLTWDPAEYGGIYAISLPEGKYWSPELEKQFPGACGGVTAYENFKIENATLSYDGKVLVYVYKLFGSLCQVDLTYYPFDEHVCIHQFYSTKYNQNELSINLLHDKIIGGTYLENQEWKVTQTVSHVVNISIQRLSVTFASNYITIERRPGFIMINKFAPACLLSALHSSLPLIPPNNERLSFAITNYLALMFLTVSFVSDMPRNSVNTTMLSYCLLGLSIAASISVLWSVFVVRLANATNRTRKIPKWLLNRIRRKSSITTPQFEDREEEKNVEEMTKEIEHEYGWYEAAMYLDKVYFITSLCIIIVLLTAVWFMYTFSKDQKNE